MKRIIILAIAAALACASIFALSSCGFFNEDKDEDGTHVHSMGDWQTTVKATCTTDGSETRSCTAEGCNHTETRVVLALGHDEKTHAARPATCTSEGWDEYVTCSRCDYSTKLIIDATGHSYKDGKCLNCGQEHLHSFGDWYGDTATCTETGEKYRDCDGCNYTQVESTPTTDHTYDESGECTECGYTKEGGADSDYELPPQEFDN